MRVPHSLPPFQDNTFILFPIFYIPQYRERLVTWDIFFYKLHNTDHTCLFLHLTKKIVLFQSMSLPVVAFILTVNDALCNWYLSEIVFWLI